MRDFTRLDRFLDSLRSDVYPEPTTEPHPAITREAIDRLSADGMLPPGSRVLDVGCGQGLALAMFHDLGCDVTGIGLGADVETCRAQGFDVREMDQSFLDFPAGAFDLLWCRHVLEHSIAPLFTLAEYRRVTKPHGLVYVEVPSPDTAAHHERNPNHYSVLPLSSWHALMLRSGFTCEYAHILQFSAECGPDTYFAALLRAD